jgi:hypothetical protein
VVSPPLSARLWFRPRSCLSTVTQLRF